MAFLLGQCKGKNWNFYIFWMLENCNVAKNQNICAIEIFNHNSHLHHPSCQKKVFENSLNTFEDIAFLLGQCKKNRKNRNFYINHLLDVGKFLVCKGNNWNFYISVALPLQNQNFCAIEIFNHNSHHSHRSPKKSFWKFVKYFWRYSISAGTV